MFLVAEKVLDRAEAQQVLATRGWLSRTPAEFRDAVLKRASLHRYTSGAAFYRIGDGPGGLYGLAKGSLELLTPRPDGEAVTAQIASAGAWVGADSMFTRTKRDFGAVSVGSSVALHLPLAAVDEIVSRDPSSWRHFGRLAAEEAAVARAVTAALLLRDGRMRGLAVLAQMMQDAADDDAHEITMSQETFAAISNLSRTSVAALLAELRCDGLVSSGYRRLVVKDRQSFARRLAATRTESGVSKLAGGWIAGTR